MAMLVTGSTLNGTGRGPPGRARAKVEPDALIPNCATYSARIRKFANSAFFETDVELLAIARKRNRRDLGTHYISLVIVGDGTPGCTKIITDPGFPGTKGHAIRHRGPRPKAH